MDLIALVLQERNNILLRRHGLSTRMIALSGMDYITDVVVHMVSETSTTMTALSIAFCFLQELFLKTPHIGHRTWKNPGPVYS